VIVAARDEAGRLEATLSALAGTFPGAALLVSDDGSRDDTAGVARRAGARVLSAGRHLGKGAAMTAAARAALDDAGGCGRAGPGVPAGEGGPVFLLCDGDLGESAAALAALVEAVSSGRADLAVAAFSSRAGGGLGILRGYARRSIARRCGAGAWAPLSGQRALTRGALLDVLPFAAGYGMEVGMTIDAVRAGHTLVELELNLSHRARGRTPAGFLHRGRQLLDVVRADAARRRGRNLGARGR
jgi:glycosyltransferase involved in cell wall biosynthesis